MGDPKRIYLQPECCAGSETGRMWCEDPNPEDCEDGNDWAEYVLVDENIRKACSKLKRIALKYCPWATPEWDAFKQIEEELESRGL